MQVSGQVDQSAGMLDEEVREKGYALLCVSEPRSDCRIKVIDEVESGEFENRALFFPIRNLQDA